MLRKKLKIFIPLLQIVILVLTCSITYFRGIDSYTILTKEQFEQEVQITNKKYNAIANISEQDDKYIFKSTTVDDTLLDLSGYPSVDLPKEKIKDETISIELKAFQINLPYNVFWHGNDNLSSLLNKDDVFDKQTTIILDYRLDIPQENISINQKFNPKTEKEVVNKIYKIYKQKASHYIVIQYKQRIVLTIISGLITCLAYLVFHIILFRKIYK